MPIDLAQRQTARLGLAVSATCPPTVSSLIRDLMLPRIDAGQERAFDLVLAAGEEGLEIRVPGDALKPVRCDFLKGAFGYRRLRADLRREALVRAVGFKGRPMDVIDATAGWGRDAAILALVGCRVRAVERSPVMAALLEDGIRRAGEDPQVGPQLSDRLAVIRADAREVLARLEPHQVPQVICIDTMFPPRSKSAAAGKQMRLCRQVSGDDDDGAEILEAALLAGPGRTVVKRALRSPPLGGREPAFTLRQRSTRYDVYPRVGADNRQGVNR